MGLQNNFQDTNWDDHYTLVFGKACCLTFELELKIYWAIKKLGFYAKPCGKRRLLEMNELDKPRLNV